MKYDKNEMKVEVRSRESADHYTQTAQLVAIDIDHLTSISISTSGVEVETFDSDGNRQSQKWFDMDDFLKLLIVDK